MSSTAIPDIIQIPLGMRSILYTAFSQKNHTHNQ